MEKRMGYFIECRVDPVLLKRKKADSKSGQLLELGYCSEMGMKTAWDYINAVMIFQNPSGKTVPFWVKNKYSSVGMETNNPPLWMPRIYEPDDVKDWVKDAVEAVVDMIEKKPNEIKITNSSVSIDKFIKEVAKNPTYNMRPSYFGGDKESRYYEISELGNPSFPPQLIVGDMFRIGSADIEVKGNKLVTKPLDRGARETITNLVDVAD